ncbi:MAG: nitrite reductase [Kofleriaceae bacterium]|nr:MAG: nitrite reductase [Kofleriaceae bacterium]
MPAWGHDGLLDPAEIECMAAFLQLDPPEAPARSLAEIRQSWELVVPVSERPTAPAHARDWENFFAVILRDPGKVAILDGTTKEEVARIDVGVSAHIVRTSSTGRYLYAVGRNGAVTMIDLWAATPQAVARVQGCYDARSVEGSKLAGWEDRYVIEGCYWPPQYVVFDGLTLEPLARNDVPLTTIDGEVLREVRTAAIVASPFEPVWLLAFKESGYVGFVDYAQDGFPLVTQLPAARFLHDGGWDHARRWFLVAANASDRIMVVDAQERTIDAEIVTGDTPHPGRGANWEDPVYGWVNATTHIGEGKLTVYGADPIGRPEHAWQIVREIALPAAGGLFLKTHPSSPWVLMDMPLASDASDARQICAYAKASGVLDRCFTPSAAGPAVHFEFDRAGAELWVSVWAQDGEIVVYDAVTLEERARIGPLDTPTGKFNVHNSTHDVY